MSSFNSGTTQAIGLLRSAWQSMVRQWRPQSIATQLGIPGVIAVGLLVGCAAFYFSVLIPLDTEIDNAQEAVQNMMTPAAGNERELGMERIPEQLDAFYRMFPARSQLTETMARVFAAATTQGIVLSRGEYQIAEADGDKLRRFQMVLPVRADYPRIRRFVDALAVSVPGAALENIQFERPKIGDAQVEATIKIALYVGRES